MKTTLKTTLEAYILIANLNSVRMKSPATSRKLFSLKMLLKPGFEFYQEEERKIVNDLEGQIEDNGKIKFPDQKEGEKKFAEERAKLDKTEWEIPIDEPLIFKDSEGVMVSGNDIELLQGLAKFTE